MSLQSLVSIGIPFYNAETTIADAIRSVFAQTYQHWELILVDDGSTDGSPAIARAIRDSRVKVVSDGQNKGLSIRLNEIARMADGEFLARMDADDLMHPDRIRQQVAFAVQHPEVDVMDTGTYSIDARNTIIGRRFNCQPDLSPLNVLEKGVLNHASVLARTRWVRANPYDPFYARAEDHELWCRCYRTSRYARVTDPLFFVRELGVSTQSKYLQTWATDRRIILKYGPGIAGSAQTAALYLRVLLKSVVYPLATLLTLDQHIIRRRNSPMPATELQAAQEVLRTIILTPLPGLDDHVGNEEVKVPAVL